MMVGVARLSTVIVAFALAAVSVASCSADAKPDGVVVGTVRMVGGPNPMNIAIRGSVSARGPVHRSARAPVTGFVLRLPAGSYRLEGRSPLIDSGDSTCFARQTVNVVAGQTVRADVICDIK